MEITTTTLTKICTVKDTVEEKQSMGISSGKTGCAKKNVEGNCNEN
jgi:hypothetical protein